MRTERINARVPPELKRALEVEAKKEVCSESRIVTLALKQYLEGKK